MKVESFRNGGHRALITTGHKGEWIKLKVGDGHTTVEITLKPAQARTVLANLEREVGIAETLAKRTPAYSQ
jgi:hypothetical protein